MAVRASAACQPASWSGKPLRSSWRRSDGMVERRQIRRALYLEYEFDRLLAVKLALAYDILVPDRVRIVGSAKGAGVSDEDRSDLRSCVVGQTTGGEHDRQPN